MKRPTDSDMRAFVKELVALWGPVGIGCSWVVQFPERGWGLLGRHPAHAWT
jgi:hypothetical protein